MTLRKTYFLSPYLKKEIEFENTWKGLVQQKIKRPRLEVRVLK